MDTLKLKEEIQKACKVLNDGGLILYPTDTIWGIGCDATNEEAVRRVYELKRRDDSKAMLVLLDDVGRLPSYVDMPDVAYDLLEAADKPMTQRSANISRPFCEMSLMALKSLHLFTYIHLANCLAVNRGSCRFSTTISNS